ncbi:DUF4232 domain-containing protein [Agromyces sp. MMS24-K17]|uniref:DUF4232 domain-containing protein n=1 Tax=Agromyces sp. MMS24-K17 TaxID=3372850 RepID=UPI0037540EE9
MTKAGFGGAALVAAACLLLAGCASTASVAETEPTPSATVRATAKPPTPTPRPTNPATNAPAADAVQAPPAPVAPEPAPDEPAPAPRCVDEQLSLAYIARPQDSGAGSFFADLVFTNVSGSDCSLFGWPGLVALDASGTQLGGPALADGPISDSVLLAAGGGIAVSALHGSQPGAWGCPAATSTALRAAITSDGAGPGVVVAASIPVCADRTSTLDLGPLVAG